MQRNYLYVVFCFSAIFAYQSIVTAKCWPSKSYVLPQLSDSSCPDSCGVEWKKGTINFSVGSTLNVTDGKQTSLPLCWKEKDLGPSCCKRSNWPKGCYCLLTIEQECPGGFTLQTAKWDNMTTITLANMGKSPLSNISSCCRCNKKFIKTSFDLPANVTFYLIKNRRSKGTCPAVNGMSLDIKTVNWFSTLEPEKNEADFVQSQDGKILIRFCQYTPDELSSEVYSEPTSDSLGSRLIFTGVFTCFVAITLLIVVCVILIIILGKQYRKKFKSNQLQSLPLTARQPLLTGEQEIEPYLMINRDAINVDQTDEMYSVVKEHTTVTSSRNKYFENHNPTSEESPIEATYHVLDGSIEYYWYPPPDEAQLLELLIREHCCIISTPDINVQSKLGEGEFGEVHRAIWKRPSGDMIVAVKSSREPGQEDERVKFLQEAAIMAQFSHPNIIKLHGIILEKYNLAIILEILTNGNLREFLRKKKEELDILNQFDIGDQILGFSQQIAEGMEYLARKKFVHRDLAARNILVDENFVCKISDFGMSRCLDDSYYYKSRGGLVPLKWTAPEAIGFKKYSTASDVWSYGCVLYELWSLGEKPLNDLSMEETFRQLMRGYRQCPPPGCPRAIYQLMIDTWHPDRNRRPSFRSIGFILRQPKPSLFHWSEEDLSIHEDIKKIGANPSIAECLYPDLQSIYTEQDT